MEAIFFALISFFGWGVGSVFSVVAARRLGGYSTTFWMGLTGLCLLTLYTPFVLNDLKNLTFPLLFLNFIIGVLGWIGAITGYKSLSITNAALAVTIQSSYPILAVILSIIIFKESITINQAIAIMIIFSGLIVMSVNLNQLIRRQLIISKGILLSFITFVCFGFYAALIKIPVQEIGWFWPVYIGYTLLPIILIYAKLANIKITGLKNNVFLYIILTVILFRTAEFSYNFAISRGLISVVAPIAGANPTLFVILAFLVFKDPITKQQILGIITTLIGIVLLSVFSV